MIRVLVSGCGGKMGRTVVDMVNASDWCEVVAGIDQYPPSNQPYPIFLNFADCDIKCDVIIDFSRPDILRPLLDFAKRMKVGAVLATTGFSAYDEELIIEASKEIPIFKSANMSLGINIVKELIQQAARTLKQDCDIEIIEAHHNRKVDAPSGTALLLADAINDCYGGRKRYNYGRYGGEQRRTSSEIGIHAVRGGNIVGDHDIKFICDDEIIEVSHSAQSRSIFAAGALKAARYIATQKPRLYNMEDLIGSQSAVTEYHTTEHQAVFSLYGIDMSLVSQIFERLAKDSINVDMISHSPSMGGVDISFTMDATDATDTKACIQSLGLTEDQYSYREDIAKLTIQGNGIEDHSGIVATLYSAFMSAGILPLLVTTSKTRISCGILSKDIKRAVEITKEVFKL